jgi:ring-1,2-phenylacetyl-CoA epoxidase subunit PaaC
MAGGWLNGVKRDFTKEEALQEYLLFLADDSLILGQQLSKWCSNGPVLEQDIAIINTALDHIGRARLLYQNLAELKGGSTTEDSLAYFRDHLDFRNALLLEQPNGHWGDSIVRSFFIDTFNFYLYESLRSCSYGPIAEIAEKSIKEISYHAQWSAEWVIRLGDGTEESHDKVQQSVNELWMWTGELFETLDAIEQLDSTFTRFNSLKNKWLEKVDEVLNMATLSRPDDKEWMQTGGRYGIHSARLGFILAEMQSLPRTYPDAQW